nr:DegT/DnrJ/EryC1/StrS family aminotransferase [uncultured Blautia sp.]
MTKMYLNSSIHKTSKEIGSYFYFSEDILYDVNQNWLCMPKDYSYLSTCRSAINICLKQIKSDKKIALLPSFTCHAVVEPFIKNGYLVFPYAIKENFEIDIDRLLKQLETVKPNVILIHDYFGINTNRKIKDFGVEKILKKMKIQVIVDRTQSMFSTYQQIRSDYCVGSIRKWLGIPDGAFVNLKVNVVSEDKELSDSKSKAMLYKNDYIVKNKGDKETLLKLYREAESILDARSCTYSMSKVSEKIISNTSFEHLKEARRRNYEILAKGLADCNFIKIPCAKLEENEVPFYFPVFVQEKRTELQKYLADNEVYATVIWACPDNFLNLIDEISNRIYKEILCIPCDQRYTEEDMKYIIDLMMNFKEEKKYE